MGCIIKTLFVTIPLAILILGTALLWQGAEFWLNVSSNPKEKAIQIEFSTETPFEVTLFVPNSIRPEYSPQELEVEVTAVSLPSESPQNLSVKISDDCNVIRIDNSQMIFSFTAGSVMTKSESAELVTRRMVYSSRPPTSCRIFFNIETNSINKLVNYSIPIDLWTGQVLAIAKILFGFLFSVVGIGSALALFF